MLATVLEILVNNGAIQAPELGVLSRTSKEMNKVVSQDCWERLCLLKWPITKDLPEEFKKAMGFRSLCKEWSAPMSEVEEREKIWSPLPPPSCKAEELALIIQVFYEGKPVAFQQLSADNFKQFLDGGKTKVHFENSSTICKAKWKRPRHGVLSAESELKAFGFDKSIDENKISWNIHLLRYKDFSMCRIGEELDCYDGPPPYVKLGQCHPLLDDRGVWSPSTKFDIKKEQKPLKTYWTPLRYFLPLKDTKTALKISARMEEPIIFNLALDWAVAQEEGNLSLTGATIHALQVNDCGDILHENDGSSYVEDHGVTLLHYLSELDATSYRQPSNVSSMSTKRKR